MSLGPIPRSKIREYASEKGLSRVMMDIFEIVIRRMDGVYREYISEGKGQPKKVEIKGR